MLVVGNDLICISLLVIVGYLLVRFVRPLLEYSYHLEPILQKDINKIAAVRRLFTKAISDLHPVK